MASKIKVDQIQTADGTGTIALQNQLSGMTSASMPTGSIVQVVSTETSAYVATGNSWADAFTSDLSITTKGANKLLIIGSINGIVMFDAAAYIQFNITDGSSNIQTIVSKFASGTNSANDPYDSLSFQHLTGVKSANTAYTYNVQFRNDVNSNSARLSGDSNSIRTLTIMEIQQ